MTLDISTPELLCAAVGRAMHNKAQTRRLFVALRACSSGRRRHAGKTLAEAWWSADHDDLYWLICKLRQRLYPGPSSIAHHGVLDRLNVIADQLCPVRSGKTRAKLYRAWFTPFGELQRTWNV